MIISSVPHPVLRPAPDYADYGATPPGKAEGPVDCALGGRREIRRREERPRTEATANPACAGGALAGDVEGGARIAPRLPPTEVSRSNVFSGNSNFLSGISGTCNCSCRSETEISVRLPRRKARR